MELVMTKDVKTHDYGQPKPAVQAGQVQVSEQQIGRPRMRVALVAIRRTLAGAQTKAFLGSPTDSR
jgi:hypothetical protein